MRLIRNFTRSLLLLAATASLIWYNYQMNGASEVSPVTKQQCNLVANCACVFVGFLLVYTWEKKQRKPSDQLSETLSLNGTSTGAGSVNGRGKTGKRG